MRFPTTSFEDAPFEIIDGDRGNAYPNQDELRDTGHCLFLSATNVTKSGFDFSSGQFIDEQKDSQLRKGKLNRRDLVLTTRGTLGNSAFYKQNTPYEHVRINSGMVILRCHSAKIIPEYLYSYLRSGLFLGQVDQLRTGAAQPQLPIRDMKRIYLPLPEIPVQERIVGVLSAYDDLIENNRRRIALLEQAARLLYEEWFVRFRFPGHENTKFIKGMPFGWEANCLEKICQDVREHAEPNEFDAETPYIGLEHLPRRSITLSDWGKAEEVTSGKFRFAANDILFGKIRPYFHKVGFALTDGITSSDAIVIRPVEARVYYFCLCLLSSDVFVALASKTVKEGSKMPRADWKFLREQKFPLPPDGLLERFNSKIAPIAAQLKALAIQGKKATAARDLLLPRLMSGEVEV